MKKVQGIARGSKPRVGAERFAALFLSSQLLSAEEHQAACAAARDAAGAWLHSGDLFSTVIRRPEDVELEGEDLREALVRRRDIMHRAATKAVLSLRGCDLEEEERKAEVDREVEVLRRHLRQDPDGLAKIGALRKLGELSAKGLASLCVTLDREERKGVE